MHVWATAATSEPLPPELDRSAPMPPDAAAASVGAALPEPANNHGKPGRPATADSERARTYGSRAAARMWPSAACNSTATRSPDGRLA